MINNVFYLLLTFLISLVFCSSLIYLIEYYYLNNSCGKLSFPLNLEDLKQQVENIDNCFKTNRLPIHIIHMLCFVFLQTWCIPGTLLFNLFGGAIFGLKLGFILCLTVNLYFKINYILII